MTTRTAMIRLDHWKDAASNRCNTALFREESLNKTLHTHFVTTRTHDGRVATTHAYHARLSVLLHLAMKNHYKKLNEINN